MKTQELNYLITPDSNVLIGAPSNIDWANAKGEFVDNCLHIKKDKELLFLEIGSEHKELINLIKANSEIVLSYVSDQGPQFISVSIKLN